MLQTIPESSEFKDKGELSGRLENVSVDSIHTTPEIVKLGLYTRQLAIDPKIIYKNGYLGAQVIDHFLRINEIPQDGRPSTIKYSTLCSLLEIRGDEIVQSVGELLNKGIPVLEDGKIRIQKIYDVWNEFQKIEKGIIAKGKRVYTEQEEFFKKYSSLVKFVVERIAIRLPSNIKKEELMNSAIIGLFEAKERYDPKRGVTFKTYAAYRIKGAVLDELRSNDSVPRSVRRHLGRIEEATRAAELQHGENTDLENILDIMGISLEQYYKIQNKLATGPVLSLDELDELNRKNPQHKKVDPCSDAPSPLDCSLSNELKGVMKQAISKLTKKEQIIISLYYDEELTLKEIGKVFKRSESRISQIHSKIKIELRNKLIDYLGLL